MLHSDDLPVVLPSKPTGDLINGQAEAVTEIKRLLDDHTGVVEVEITRLRALRQRHQLPEATA